VLLARLAVLVRMLLRPRRVAAGPLQLQQTSALRPPPPGARQTW
jgi:hypothetical protein